MAILGLSQIVGCAAKRAEKNIACGNRVGHLSADVSWGLGDRFPKKGAPCALQVVNSANPNYPNTELINYVIDAKAATRAATSETLFTPAEHVLRSGSHLTDKDDKDALEFDLDANEQIVAFRGYKTENPERQHWYYECVLERD
jgi:hypothetical protein